MQLFIVIKQGVYIQGIYGIYDNYADAEIALEEAEAKEPDNYHKFDIEERILNVRSY